MLRDATTSGKSACVRFRSHRVLREGGVLLAVAINRYAGVIYGLTHGLVFERDYVDMTLRELSTGIRNNPPAQMKTFREAYSTPTGSVNSSAPGLES